MDNIVIFNYFFLISRLNAFGGSIPSRTIISFINVINFPVSILVLAICDVTTMLLISMNRHLRSISSFSNTSTPALAIFFFKVLYSAFSSTTDHLDVLARYVIIFIFLNFFLIK